MADHKVGVLIGSLRRGSISRKVAGVLREVAPPSLALEEIEIGRLELYNQDLDETPPPSWTSLRSALRSVDAVLFVTPEYNRSIPSALKNAIDIGSRPYGQSAWQGKPGGVVSVSVSAIAGFGANHHLRQSLVYLDVLAMAQPEAYIGQADKLFDDRGQLVNASTREFLSQFMQQFAQHVAGRAANRDDPVRPR